jgi:transposase
MNEDRNFIGIDISKDTFDVFSLTAGHAQFSNDSSGFKTFIKTLNARSWVVMEATGSYSARLAHYLYDRDKAVSVVNPLVMKRYIQMKLRRLKTDKSDAQMIASYAREQPLDLWEPDAEYIEESKDLYGTQSLYIKQRTALKNRLHSLEAKGKHSGSLVRSIKRQLKQLDKEISGLEQALETLMKEHEPDLFTRLRSIPGVGKKTALQMIVVTSAFKHFESAKQVSAYVGLAPMERRSGSSIRGRSYISKVGDKTLRNHLFMCSFTASVHNPACRALYERLVAKGKSKKLALIAVCNKLIKQAFAIAKSGLPYDPEYRSVKPV